MRDIIKIDYDGINFIVESKIYCLKGGLMEDPDFHWELIGSAFGNSLKECCDNLAKKDENFKRDYDPDSLSFWGWKLGFENDVVNDVLGKAISERRLGM